MAKKTKLWVIVIVAAIIVSFASMAVMYNRAATKANETGQMKLDNIAADLQELLNRRIDRLNQIGNDLETMIAHNASNDEISEYLSQQKANEIAASDGTFSNVFCMLADSGDILISDMDAPEDYVIQDREWYKGLMAEKTGEAYISNVYKDAFTDGMCFTIAKLLSDGRSILGIDYNVAELQKYIEKMNIDGYGDAMIANNKGIIVCYSDINLVGQKLSAELPEYQYAFTKAVAEGKNISVKKSGTTVFCSRMANDWYLMLGMDNSDLYHISNKKIIYGVLIRVFLIAALIAFFAISNRKRTNAPSNNISDKGANAEITPNGAVSGGNSGHKPQGTHENVSPGHTMLTIKTQQRFRFLIIAVFVATMIITITINAILNINWSKAKMREEISGYSYEIGNWVLEQKSILDMFVNVISANPSILENYEGMVTWLNDVTKHYPGISATYIANPDFAFTHGHPMVMNNGWVPDEDYVEEERDWYIGAVAAEDFYITEPYFDARTGEYCVTFSKAVYSDDNLFLGVFAIDFYLDALIDILGGGYSDDGYAFLVDKEGQLINHPNPEYQSTTDELVNIHDLVYERAYGKNDIVTLRDYDNEYRSCMMMNEDFSGFNVVVLKRAWSIYGDVVIYSLLYLVLFGICIIGVNTLIVKMIHWQQEANESLEEAVELAKKADKAKSKFLAQMSHEIRTPINAVLGMNEMILREKPSMAIREYALNVQSAGTTLLSLINGILDFSKIEDGKMEIIPVDYDTASLINDMVNIVSEKLRAKSLELKLEIDPEIPCRLYGDDIRIRQIITNILTNAAKYTPEGSVTLRMKSVASDDEGKMLLHVEVEDTGIGIKPEDMDKLFSSFQRLEEERNRNIEGTGLGIAITNSLLIMMGSKLMVESTYGKGSLFWFEVPQKIMSAEPIGDYDLRRQQSLEETRNQRYIFAPDAQVLVVDDNRMNLKVASGLLKRNGINPDVADGGMACLEYVKKYHYDIIFMDHMMPEMNGIETLKKLKEDNLLPDDTIVIMMTANAILGAREEYLQEGFVDYISKPIVVAKLEEALEKYLPSEKISYKTEGDEAEEASKENIAQENTPKEDSAAEASEETPQGEAASKKPGLDERFPFLDTKTGMEYFADDEVFYIEMLKSYVDGANMQDIDNALNTDDIGKYQTLVHALKSTSLSIGAAELSEQAKALEHAAKSNDIDFIRQNHNACMDAYRDLVEKLAEALN